MILLQQRSLHLINPFKANTNTLLKCLGPHYYNIRQFRIAHDRNQKSFIGQTMTFTRLSKQTFLHGKFGQIRLISTTNVNEQGNEHNDLFNRNGDKQPSKNRKDEKSNQNHKDNKSFSEILDLLRLTKPEIPKFAIAMVLLCISSAVSMLFPTIMGKIIDTANPEKTDVPDGGIEKQTKIFGIPMPSTIHIFSKDVATSVFYGSLGVIFLIGAGANFGRIVLLRTIGERIMMNMRVNILGKILLQDAKFWDYHKAGDLISRLVNDSTVVARSVTQNVSNGMRSLISGFVGMGMMIAISAKLTAYMMIIFPVLLFIALVFGRRVKRVSRDIQSQLGSLTKVCEEQFNFVKTIQSFNNEKYEVGKFKKEVKKLYNLSIFEGKLNGVFYGTNGFIGNTFLLFMLTLGTYMVRQGNLSLGELSSYLMYTTYSATSVYSLSNFYSELMKGVGASGRVFELLRLKPSIDPEAGQILNVNGDIVLKHVHFKYPTRPHDVIFQDLSLTVKKGDHVCLVGPSGCGKSTIAQLLLRYYSAESGSISANKHALNDVNIKCYREQVGVVDQEPTLFSGTIRENLAYGRKDVSDEDIWKVCDLAYCSHFIREFPEGLYTIIGSKGAQLSGGQKQRVALARALLLGTKIDEDTKQELMDREGSRLFDSEGRTLLGPSILLLDEATSALDAHSEDAIKNTLNLRGEANLTTISIAHRVSTIKMSNIVVVLDSNGNIVEQGGYYELTSKPDSELNKLLRKDMEKGSVEIKGKKQSIEDL
ncbi:MDL1 [Brettanomyces bruxellensis]|uniref:DEBR0S2_05380g1_1 n=1 Tax=Dekkera bruxellensis TaxID=5007 RepID=A0A7D9CWE4_DEKBR|nr:MDL1 [Brettanomyces bruxellensis]